MEPSRRPITDELWPWYLVTGVYLSLGILVVTRRWDEIGSLIASPAANQVVSGRLPLNSIGDILAGFFAPLAFLWLFVATQLQRKELRLQREELAETRSVLSEQKTELERTARESNYQTKIMQETLDSTNTRVLYDELNLRLYLIAKACVQSRFLEFNVKQEGSEQESIIRLGYTSRELTHNEPASVDFFFGQLLTTSGSLAIPAILKCNVTVHQHEEGYAIEYIDFIIAKLEELMAHYEGTTNSLISLRFNGMSIKGLTVNMSVIKSRIFSGTYKMRNY